MPLELLRDTQMERLRATLRNAYQKRAVLPQKLDELGVPRPTT